MNDRLLCALRREPTDVTPVWFMRQAGRYMPEYRALRQRYSLLEMAQTPELATQVTLQPVHAMPVDAAILFADILLPVIPMGLDLSFAAGEGPVVGRQVRTMAAVQALPAFEPDEELSFVMETIRLLRRELRVPLIGFAGAPFTLASYIIEGGSSRHYVETKRLMYGNPAAWHALMAYLARMTVAYLRAQIVAGAQAVQLFDSWIGCLSAPDFHEYALPYIRQVMTELHPLDAPVIYFGTDMAAFLPDLAAIGAAAVGVDWRMPLDRAWAALGDSVAIQGNLDPVALFAPRQALERQVRDVLRRAGGRPGHIFNLGHGILPDTPVDAVRAAIDLVHSMPRYSMDGRTA